MVDNTQAGVNTMEKGTARAFLTRFQQASVENGQVVFPIHLNGKTNKPHHLPEYIRNHAAALLAFGIAATLVDAKAPPKHVVDLEQHRAGITELLKTGYKIPGLDVKALVSRGPDSASRA